MAKKKRIDCLLVDKGIIETREKAKRVVMEGVVFIGEERIDKPGQKVDVDSEIFVKYDPVPYVGRGGLKLERAIDIFHIELQNKIVMDVGASTGGFTDCMLKNGAKKVYAIDVGYGQLDWKLRKDERVIVKERTNIRYVKKEDIGEEIDFVSIDVSFISLRLVLPVVKELLKDNGSIVALIKPQFEAGREKVGKKGLVKDKKVHIDVINTIVEFCKYIDLNVNDITYSPIKGAKGNIEYLAFITKRTADDDKNNTNDIQIANIVDEAHRKLK